MWALLAGDRKVGFLPAVTFPPIYSVLNSLESSSTEI